MFKSKISGYIIWSLLFLLLGSIIPLIKFGKLIVLTMMPLIMFIGITCMKFFTVKKDKSRITMVDIDKMTGLEFEKFLGVLFSKQGYQAEVTQASNDQGADLLIKRSSKLFWRKNKTVIQAKRYKNNVGNSAVQEVVAAKAHYNCKSAMVITNSKFTAAAKKLAISNKVKLWDRDKLKQEVKKNPVSFTDLKGVNMT
ncbi:putative endonuclease related to Holliday junction resolvase [Halobacteroides halobius DSM 5150]|uniref:Putative endonuclease related to Holliday junction resolvase n=2 Tax=Halobacteroides TaxID=42417 RepID=L0K6H0_HALHC|nr:putative endonuclease related to Holliday junction resolvase [Halobacteroides halobius DSM 5150]